MKQERGRRKRDLISSRRLWLPHPHEIVIGHCAFEGSELLIVLNGYPGVGKLTIGRELTALIGGRLLVD